MRAAPAYNSGMRSAPPLPQSASNEPAGGLDPEPFYDPARSYESNYNEGPFGQFRCALTSHEALTHHDALIYNAALTAPGAGGSRAPLHDFAGVPVRLPFGIPAGPLVNGSFVRAALRMGFDLPVYKTVRTRAYASHGWPNVLAVHPDGDLCPGVRLTADHSYTQPLNITNSFGVPSMSPDVWQPDLAAAVASAGPGQCVIGSFQGTLPVHGEGHTSGFNLADEYIADFRLGARLMRETGVRLVEVNLSCPNEGTANLLCFDAERSARVCEAIAEVLGDTPLLIKLAYFADDAHLRRVVAAVAPFIAGISTINTLPAEIVDAAGGPALPGAGRRHSGVCGAGIRWAGLEMVRRVAAIRREFGYDFVITGVGGVTTPADFRAYRAAGADAVMSAAGAMWNAQLAQQIAAAESLTAETRAEAAA